MPPELEQQYSLDHDPAASDSVQQVAGEVLETMFFTEAELANCGHTWLGSAACARILFEGSHFGEMLLGVSAEAADVIAASFLGLDPEELTEAQRGQVIQELTNILCGAILSRLWPESKLALSSPELTAWQEWASAGGPLHRCFQLPEGMLAISIRLILSGAAGTVR
jgi:CheY-specific phosphatase CheX